MTTDDALQAILAVDKSIVGRAAEVPGAIVPEIERALGQLEDDAPLLLAIRLLAAVDAPGTIELLLKIAAESDPTGSGAAVDAICALPIPPPTDVILGATPKIPERISRGKLYRLVGRSGDPKDLPKLRAATATERARAARDAQVACAKLGGREEREAFGDRIEEATAEDALDVAEDLFYVGDLKLARHLAPWLPNKEPVIRIGPDAHAKMARMCDVAVQTAVILGVAIPGATPKLDVQPPAVIDAATAALHAL